MATSGSYDYSRTAANLITIALENVGVLAAGGTVASADTTTCLARLNLIAKAYSGTTDFARGLKYIARQRVTLALAEGQQSYLIGPASSDARASTQMGRTTIRTAEAAGQTVLDITATTDTTTYPGTTITMTASDIIGIEQNDGTIFWTTISSTGAGPVVTVGAGLDVAAAAGNYVFWFTSRAQRLLMVESAVLRDENNTDRQLKVFRTVEEYEAGVADKYADGDPSCILVEPLRIATRITLDSQPNDVTKRIILTGLYPMEDYDASSDDVSFPQEALRFLAWELSFDIWETYNGNSPWPASAEKKRLEAREVYLNLNPEMSNAYFMPGGL